MLLMPGTRSLIAYNGYDSGLGNRVRVVLGAKSLAELERRDFYFVWPTGPLFGPKMSDLWHFSGRTVSRSTSRLLARRYPYVDERLDWLTPAKRAEKVWQIRTGSPLQLPPAARSWQDEFRALRPVEEIASTVRQLFDGALSSAPYVGVMIRAHSVSHAKTRAASPVEWFVRRMKEIRQQAPEVRFFLSCDVSEVQQQVMSEIPGCFGQSDKGGYNTVKGVRAAVADLYLLASAGHLLGPHWSSFVHLAEYLSGDALELETAVNQNRHVVDYSALSSVSDPLRPFLRS